MSSDMWIVALETSSQGWRVGSNLVSTDIHSSETLDPFRAYYVTKYIDHHAHTLVF